MVSPRSGIFARTMTSRRSGSSSWRSSQYRSSRQTQALQRLHAILWPWRARLLCRPPDPVVSYLLLQPWLWRNRLQAACRRSRRSRWNLRYAQRRPQKLGTQLQRLKSRRLSRSVQYSLWNKRYTRPDPVSCNWRRQRHCTS